MDRFADAVLSWASFASLCLAVLVAPWFFAAWEMWWFWPFAVALFLGVFFFGVRLVLWSLSGAAPPAGLSRGAAREAWAWLLAASPFLAYALARFARAEVFMDAERSFLLFVTPVALGATVFFGFDGRQARAFFLVLLVDLAALGLYGLVNHLVTGSRVVLWRPGYSMYTVEGRETGTYFCPDHFSGLMEIGLCFALGLLLSAGVRRGWKSLAAALAALAAAAVALSKSRGGGATVVALVPAVLVWGFLQRRAAVRWLLRGGALVAAAAGLILFVLLAGAYMERFGRYFRWEEIRDKPVPEMAREVLKDLPYTSRGLIIWGALRAWQSEPVWGVGPGMHQNVWPHFCATPDGDRELGIWPSRPHHGDHAYAAHCDWVQLLEEYGAVGLALLLAPALCLLLALDAAVRRAARRWRERAAAGPADGLPHAAALGALLAFLAMAFHSLGDYNLQMPATVWVLAAGIALALRQAGDRAAEGGGAEARR